MRKRLLAFLLCLVMALSLLPVTEASAAGGSGGGSTLVYGDGWYIDGYGCLYLTGAIRNPANLRYSATPGFHAIEYAPWFDYTERIVSVVARPGSSVNNGHMLFAMCHNLISVDLANLDTSQVVNMSYMFEGCESLKYVDLSRLDTSNVTDMSYMFSGCESLDTVTFCDFEAHVGINVENVKYLQGMFKNCDYLTYIDFRSLEFDNLVSVESMFMNCRSLYHVDFGYIFRAKPDNMFNGCYALYEINGLSYFISLLAEKDFLCRDSFYNRISWEDADTGESYSDEQLRKVGYGDLVRMCLRQQNAHLIHFDPCGGNFPFSYLLSYDEFPHLHVAAGTPPTREGAIFQGWYTAPEGGEPVNIKWTIDQDCTVYAHWTFVTASGGLNNSEKWDLDSEGTLRIWWPYDELGKDISEYKDQIKRVKEQTTASIDRGDGFFKDCKNLVSVDLLGLSLCVGHEFESAVDMFTGCVNLKELKSIDFIIKKTADQLLDISDYWIDRKNGVVLTSVEQFQTHTTKDSTYPNHWEIIRYTPEDLKVNVDQSEDKMSATANWTALPFVGYYEVQLMRYLPTRDNYYPSGDVKRVTGKAELTFDSTDFALSDTDGENRWRVSVKAYSEDGVLLTENISSAFKTGLRFLKNPAPTLDPDGLLHWDPVPNANKYTVELKDQNFSTVKTLTMSDTEIDLFGFMNDGEMYYCYVTAFDTTGQYLASDSVRTEHVVCQNCEFYNIWIGRTPITDRNKDDVLGNGTVRFYPAGEYTGVSLDNQSTFGDRFPTLVLDNFNMTGDAFHTDGAKAAQIYIDSDVNIVLKGTSTLYRYSTANGIYIANGRYVWFYGVGTLNVDVSWNDKDALVGASPALIFHDSVKVNLTGACAIRYVYDPHNGDDFITITDHAKVRCFSKQTAEGRDYPAIITADLTIGGDGWLICESQYNCQALNSWGVSFSNNDYDIEILKRNEYQYDGYTPYKPENGVDVPGGVSSLDCRYLSVHAGATPEADPVPVSTVNIAGLKLPVAGEKAGENLMSIYPATEGYFIYEAAWVCLEDYYQMLPDDAFEAGKSYALGVGVSPEKGYTLSESTPFVFNGGDVAAWDDIKNITDDGLYGFTQILEVGEPERIESVNITGMKEPQAGEKAGDNLKSLAAADESYSIDQATWVRIEDNFDVYEMRPNDVFEAGRKYVLGVSVAAERGYALSEDTAFTFNGGDIAAWDEIKNLYEGLLNGFTQIYEIGTIDKVAVDMKIPVVGAKVGDFLDLTPADPRYSFEYVVWAEPSNGHLDENDVFKAGKCYYLLFNVVPAAGYAVTKDTAVTINGGSVQSYVVYDDGILSCNSFLVDPVEKPASQGLLGDVNDDGKVNQKDVARLRQYLADSAVYPMDAPQNADVNKDGKVNQKDVARLRQFLADPVAYPLG